MPESFSTKIVKQFADSEGCPRLFRQLGWNAWANGMGVARE